MLEGLFLDTNDQPVPNARVAIDARPSRHISTADDGSFQFTGLPPGQYRVVAWTAGFSGGPVTTVLTLDSEPVIIRALSASSLRVQVSSDDGKSVPGAKVELRGLAAFHTTTDETGVAVFNDLPSGRYVIHTDAVGFASNHTAVRIAPRAKRHLTVELHAGVVVQGLVTSDLDQPLDGYVVVRDLDRPFAPLDGRPTNRIGEDGSWSVRALGSGRYRFIAIAKGFAPSVSEVVKVEASDIQTVEIALTAGMSVLGEVVDADGRGVAGATVTASIHTPKGLRIETRADGQGRFKLDGLRPGAVVFAMSERARSSGVVIDAGSEEQQPEITIVLGFDGAIRGQIVDRNGEPVPEAIISAVPQTWRPEQPRDVWTRTDYDGRFVLRGVEHSVHDLYAKRHEWADARRAAGTAKPGDDVRLELADEGRIRGTVRFGDGTSPAAFELRIDAGPPARFAGPTGEFALSDIPPGSHRLRISGPGFASRVAEFTVEQGSTTALNLTVARGRTVSVRVTGPNRRPVAGAQVHLGSRLVGDGSRAVSPALRAQLGAHSATTSEDGVAVFHSTGAGEYVVVAEQGGWRSVAARLPRGMADADIGLALGETATVEGIVLSGGQPVRGGHVLAMTEQATQLVVPIDAATGRFSLDQLAPGSYQLLAIRDSAGPASAGQHSTVTVSPGDHVETTLNMSGEGGVRLVLEVTAGESLLESGQVFMRATTGASPAVMSALIQHRRVTFPNVSPGEYKACAVAALAGNRVLGEDELAAASCRTLVIPEHPAEQTLTLEVE